MGRKIICLVIPSLEPGGMERVMSELAGYFCHRDNLEIHLVMYGMRPELFYTLPAKVIVHKPVTIFNNKLRFIYTVSRLIYLRKTVKNINPDSVLSFGELWNSFTLLALLGLSYPVYISDRCSPEKKFDHFHTFLRRRLYPKAKGIIAQTEKAKHLYQRQFRHDNITVIGNPIRQISYNDMPKANVVLTVGRLIESKNHDKLIQLFCNINQPGWKLVIIGGDSLKQKNMSRLKNLISTLNAEAKVILTGSRNDIDRFYQQSSVFAFASESEGFPNVIGEAMSAGLPVVSFDCVAGPSEMITDGENGYLIPVNDYSLFLKRLEQLMANGALCKTMGSKAIESIQKFSIAAIGAKYYDFIIAK